jgi:hypothetical protein
LGGWAVGRLGGETSLMGVAASDWAAGSTAAASSSLAARSPELLGGFDSPKVAALRALSPALPAAEEARGARAAAEARGGGGGAGSVGGKAGKGGEEAEGEESSAAATAAAALSRRRVRLGGYPRDAQVGAHAAVLRWLVVFLWTSLFRQARPSLSPSASCPCVLPPPGRHPAGRDTGPRRRARISTRHRRF